VQGAYLVRFVAASNTAVINVDEAKLLRELLKSLGDVRASHQIYRIN
jgi:hypothetical protein